MAITALATQNTTVGPTQFADMMWAMDTPCKVDSAADLRPTLGANRQISIAPGAGMVGGSRVRSTSVETVTLDTVSSGSRWDVVCLRVDWLAGTAAIVVVKGTSSGFNTVTSGTSPDTSKVNRLPGIMYDLQLAICKVTTSGVSEMVDGRMWGGDGAAFFVSQSLIDNTWTMGWCKPGTTIQTDKGQYTKRLDNDGTWRSIGTAANPWIDWTPTLRYWEDKPNTGNPNDAAGIVNLGGSSTCRGRYRIDSGYLTGKISIVKGVNSVFGWGPLTVDLPKPVAAGWWDLWWGGHIYLDKRSQGSGVWDFACQLSSRGGSSVGAIWAPYGSGNVELRLHRAADSSFGNGTGSPYINGAISDGDVYAFDISYPVDL